MLGICCHSALRLTVSRAFVKNTRSGIFIVIEPNQLPSCFAFCAVQIKTSVVNNTVVQEIKS